MKTASLSKRGYLEGSQEVAQLMANLISAFTMVNNISRADAGETYTRYPVNRAVSTHVLALHALYSVLQCTTSCSALKYVEKSADCASYPTYDR